MTSVSEPVNLNKESEDMPQKLMVHGYVCPESTCSLSIEVRRGMSILSKEGLEVGRVAAVILDRDTQKATHLLLGRLPEISGYWMVPVQVIAEVGEGVVRLAISADVVDTLPQWQSRD